MRRLLLTAAALSLAPLSAGATTVREFIARWKAVEEHGMAQADPELHRLVAELGRILDSYRDDVQRGKPIGCPPPRGQADFDTKSMFDFLNRLSPVEQEMEMKDAVYAYLAKIYPCP